MESYNKDLGTKKETKNVTIHRLTNDLEELNNKIQHLETVLLYAYNTNKIYELVKDYSSKLIANKTLKTKVDEQKFLITDLKQECFQCLTQNTSKKDTVNIPNEPMIDINTNVNKDKKVSEPMDFEKPNVFEIITHKNNGFKRTSPQFVSLPYVHTVI